MKTPHLVQYQGSKRNIAKDIIKYIPTGTTRIIEPFAGTCAVSILCAQERKCQNYWLNDINQPLANLMKECVEHPQELYEKYQQIWNRQFEDGTNNVDYFYRIRDLFNSGEQSPEMMLFLLARVVKGAVRYNDNGQMNQSCDKRRNGTKPEQIRKSAFGISELLKGKSVFTSLDYKDVLKQAVPGDLIYMDPPYQGTSKKDFTRDNRYFQGVDFDEFVDELNKLNERNIDYIVSYDGMTGERKIGNDLPDYLSLSHLYINAGNSAQSTLNGKSEITYESLYLSKNIKLQDFFEQITIDFYEDKAVAL